MENLSFKIFIKPITYLIVMCASFGCTDSDETPAINESVEEMVEKMISQNWKYVKIVANGYEMDIIDWGFEPTDTFGGSLDWYWYSYNEDKSYEFRIDANGHILLGYEDNFQPYYGYWEASSDGTSIVHNKGTSYETNYRIIELTDSSFVREYERIVYYTTNPEKWEVGSTVTYREFFEIRTEVCCPDDDDE